ncbi:MAG: TrkH family potassium uptake protein [Clostridia bacterium]|nr:TrkH family potassium uptake protein [Clostridia bacterium]MBR0509292.1 TrkH family potassium uptake protein [Clostridia bacterium]MBR0536766.1 TrkH family potassium uptake protein [Clostridia bacterium]
MNRRMILYMPLQILRATALLMLLPAAVSIYYREPCVWSFLICSGGALLLSIPAAKLVKPYTKEIYAKDGFVIVALSWILLSALGALPFTISGEIPSYVDAFFETVSGFTTTGASILTHVESMSRGLLFWRSFTHFLGGMGVIVFVMAITNLSDRPIHIMRAEMPGPIVGKLVPKAKQTAKILYLIYIVLTLTEIALLKIGGMSLFEATVHAFGTAGTGGFGIRSDSIAGYTPFAQWVITVFMMVFGVNFNLYYLILIRNFKTALKSRELWVYCGIFGGSTLLVTLNVLRMFPSFGTALRHAAFQVSSIMTTTGFVTTDYDRWPQLSKTVLLLLMFIGACAGSTAGGLKVSRVIILGKTIHREVTRMLHPRSVRVIRFEGKKLEEAVIHNTAVYFVLYFICVMAGFFLLSIEPLDLESCFTAVVACFNNIGPAFGAAGPASNYAVFSPFSKLVLSAAMLLGRLEIFPLILAFSPTTWMKK